MTYHILEEVFHFVAVDFYPLLLVTPCSEWQGRRRGQKLVLRLLPPEITGVNTI